MATRRERQRINAAVAVFGLVFTGLMVFSMVLIMITEGVLTPKTYLIADFRKAGGIGRNSGVQLAGNKIGKVVGVEFIREAYPCDPRTEDFGHRAQGRTDLCEPWMFCVPVDDDDPSAGLCSELEDYSGSAIDFEGCDGSPDSCPPQHICVTKAFRSRYRDVSWYGPSGLCVRYETESQRIRVTMEVDEPSLEHISTESRASVVLNGIFADPVINVSVGLGGDPIQGGDRLQTEPSLMDELVALKDQIDRLSDEIEAGLTGVTALTDTLGSEQAKADMQALEDNVAAIKKQVADAEGLVGAVLNDPNMRTEIAQTLRETRSAIGNASSDYEQIERDAKRAIKDVEDAAKSVEKVMDGLEDPNNRSLVAMLMREDGIRSEANRLADGTQEAIGAGKETFADIDAVLGEIMTAIENREGSLGKAIRDPKVLYDIKDPATLRRVNVVKRLVRLVIDEEEGQGRDPMAGNPPGPDPEVAKESDSEVESESSQ